MAKKQLEKDPPHRIKMKENSRISIPKSHSRWQS
jgi:hypothetical protein